MNILNELDRRIERLEGILNTKQTKAKKKHVRGALFELQDLKEWVESETNKEAPTQHFTDQDYKDWEKLKVLTFLEYLKRIEK